MAMEEAEVVELLMPFAAAFHRLQFYGGVNANEPLYAGNEVSTELLASVSESSLEPSIRPYSPEDVPLQVSDLAAIFVFLQEHGHIRGR